MVCVLAFEKKNTLVMMLGFSGNELRKPGRILSRREIGSDFILNQIVLTVGLRADYGARVEIWDLGRESHSF